VTSVTRQTGTAPERVYGHGLDPEQLDLRVGGATRIASCSAWRPRSPRTSRRSPRTPPTRSTDRPPKHGSLEVAGPGVPAGWHRAAPDDAASPGRGQSGLTIGYRGCGAVHAFGLTKDLRAGPVPLTLGASGRVYRAPASSPPGGPRWKPLLACAISVSRSSPSV
jgi:hypothetical protein